MDRNDVESREFAEKLAALTDDQMLRVLANTAYQVSLLQRLLRVRGVHTALDLVDRGDWSQIVIHVLSNDSK